MSMWPNGCDEMSSDEMSCDEMSGSRILPLKLFGGYTYILHHTKSRNSYEKREWFLHKIIHLNLLLILFVCQGRAEAISRVPTEILVGNGFPGNRTLRVCDDTPHFRSKASLLNRTTRSNLHPDCLIGPKTNYRETKYPLAYINDFFFWVQRFFKGFGWRNGFLGIRRKLQYIACRCFCRRAFTALI